MTTTQSKINQLKARIEQYRSSGLFSEEKAEELIIPLQKELDQLIPLNKPQFPNDRNENRQVQ